MLPFSKAHCTGYIKAFSTQAFFKGDIKTVKTDSGTCLKQSLFKAKPKLKIRDINGRLSLQWNNFSSVFKKAQK